MHGQLSKFVLALTTQIQHLIKQTNKIEDLHDADGSLTKIWKV